MAPSVFPNELWINVFEELKNPADLARISRTCRKFHRLSLRTLYKRIRWTDPRHLQNGLDFLRNQPALSTVPRSLTVAISREDPRLTDIEQLSRALAIVDHVGTIQSIPHTTQWFHSVVSELSTTIGRYPILLASLPLHAAMVDLMSTFTELRELTFSGMQLPDSWYNIIQGFNRLQTLRIEYCTVPATSPTVPPVFENLPITELVLSGLTSNREPRKELRLATARNLRVLRFDWTAYVFNLFVQEDATIPAHLESIEVTFPQQKNWQAFNNAESLLSQRLASFLALCPGVTSLTVKNHVGSFELPAGALPLLRSYRGPMGAIVKQLKHCPLHTLDVRDSSGSLRSFIHELQAIASDHGDLQDLRVFAYQWDNEILRAIVFHFPHLRTLQVRYSHGSPSDDTVVSMGPHFFEAKKLPHLRVARVFKSKSSPGTRESSSAGQYLQLAIHFNRHRPDMLDSWQGPLFVQREYDEGDTEPEVNGVPLGAEIEEDLRESIIAWNRYCPNLREVQLLPGFVWRRSSEADSWCKR
ncbi:hypothetical protein BV22DRAFT_1012022 [Leucogyrophana mollusca]|uniref:Uncharacterized protein n=1 Tax=Leucogyrophana mollusca TaxID=85980 RepID=A0ACB8BGU6_9AGAM|nr:hypothetical protein BV22DRAFT_1012022 [Leucogyrophana mollusca]